MRSTYFRPRSRKTSTQTPWAGDTIQRDTMRAWESFVDRGVASADIENSVRAEILESWARCTDHGINALCRSTPQKMSQDSVQELRRKNRALCRAAKYAFQRLAPHLNESRAILLLTDQKGTVIEATGDSKTLDTGREIGLEVGGVWDEAVIGTNGIGTALRTGMPTYVHASEHFCQGIKAWTCAGVPIFDPLDRTVIGVVDLSGPPDIFRRHNVALVVAAAREIEIALAEHQRDERTSLLEAFIDLPNPRDKDDAIILLNESGRIVYSKNTEAAGNGRSGDLLVGRQLLSLDPGMSDGEVAAALPAGLTTKAIDILKAGAGVQGAALILPRKTSAAKMPANPGGIKISPRRGVEEQEIQIIGECPKMLETLEFARRAAQAKVTVLVQGETGVGKELFARLIHSHHSRQNAPYVAVNCAAISGELIGGELFGHVAGAFTGALREGKPGKFEQADGGVLCLDEIGDMPLELQSYLLRTLEQRAVYRVGCHKRRAIDVQLVAITNRDLRQDIEEGRFRRDLFYRIGTIIIDVPPLRDRGRDIDLLLSHFNQKLSKKFDRAPLVFEPEAVAALRDYQWPGNVRELRNVIERICLLHNDTVVTLADLPRDITEPDTSLLATGSKSYVTTDDMDLDQIESHAIQRAIKMSDGNLTKVAASLGISRPTLYRKIKQYGLERCK
ncbi:sigma-54-dependent Fis family transcriptional regulator [Roseobacter weihaiensis]|uniref:sigma-54-dependent Fis family transcriptional regulator n=1 Tax=Roseobacter weihaiensis TaxID=2763262 RepID=UPI001D0B7E1A|nr:sigma-54-dependent Fis family transcriptional regulator [Roseobacter sp. H9]